MTLQTMTVTEGRKYQMEVCARTTTSEVLDSFIQEAPKSRMLVYTGIASGKTAPFQLVVLDYKLNYGEMAHKHFAPDTRQSPKLLPASLSEIKPEIVGLGLGGIISLGIGLWALTTGDVGLATVMAGPFAAASLGSVLLWLGVRRRLR